MLKKGEFEQLANKRLTELEEANKKLSDLESQLKVYSDVTEKKLSDFMANVKEEDKPMVDAILSGKTIVEKENLLTGLIAKFGSPEQINASANGNGEKKKVNALQLEDAKKKMEEATKAGRTGEVLSYQRIIKELEAVGRK
jgi:hypothetical protein